jgi:hypothetical protein
MLNLFILSSSFNFKSGCLYSESKKSSNLTSSSIVCNSSIVYPTPNNTAVIAPAEVPPILFIFSNLKVFVSNDFLNAPMYEIPLI